MDVPRSTEELGGDRLGQLLAAMVDRQLLGEEREELAALLRGNRVNSRRYLEAIELHALIRLEVGLLRRGTLEFLSGKAPWDADSRPADGVARNEHRLSSASVRFKTPNSRPMVLDSPRVYSIVTAAAIVGSLLVGMAILRFPEADAPRGELANAFRSTPIATLARTDECEWNETTLPTHDGARLVPGMLSLRRGLMEVEFAGGARVVVEGPARFELRSPSAAALYSGKLVANVASRAVGFAVETPTAKIVDLGTEFGVAVDETGATEAHVFRGRIEVSRRDGTHGEKIAGSILGPGEAIRVPVGVGRPISYASDGKKFAFRRHEFPLATKSQGNASPAQVEILLADDFERPVLDESKWTVDLSSRGGGEPSISVRGGLIEIRDRGYLNTALDYDPAKYNEENYSGGIAISGRWMFHDPFDNFSIVTRSSGVPGDENGELQFGVQFSIENYRDEEKSLNIYVHDSDRTRLATVPTKLSSNVVDFEIADDGHNLSFKIKEIGGSGKSWTIEAVTPFVNPAGRNKITFYNRERIGGISCLDNVKIWTTWRKASAE